jgi:hypothetical protein
VWDGLIVFGGSCFDAVLHAVAFALDGDGFGVVEEAVEDGGSEGAVIVKDRRPFLELLVCGQDDGAAFISVTDDLEEQVGTFFIDGQVTEFVDDEYGRPQVLL